MFKTVQWKLVVIYLLLVLLAMELISVYLLQSLDQYYLDDYSERMRTEADLVRSLLVRHMAEEQEEEYITQLIDEFGKQAQNEITVLDENGRVLATSSGEEDLPGKIIVEQEITRALAGSRSGTNIRLNPNTNVREKALAIPIESENQILGAVYLVGSLERVDSTIGEIRTILFTGTVFAMIVTAFLGIVLSRTITKPVQAVTQTAEAMAKGDFDQRIEVKSDDEIGSLGKMFNHLAFRLDHTLKEISSEKGKVEAILTQMSDGVIAVNREKEIIHINPAAERMLNIQKEELVGKTAYDFFQRYFASVEFDKILADEITDTEKNITPDNHRIIRAQVVPFKAEGEQYEGIIIALTDITEQEELIQMRQEFVANVSHELRTPLTSVKSYVETLMEGAYKDEEVATRFLKVVHQETNRMVTMVKDLLILSQLDRKEPTLKVKTIDLKSVIENSVESLNNMKKEQQVDVVIDYDLIDSSTKFETAQNSKQPIFIDGDADKLTQVFTNILENAIKYSTEGGLVKVKIQEINGDMEVRITDNGMGIPLEDLPRIFERFYRVEKARSRAQGGTGLGLAIAKEIIQAHGGDINVSSQEGKGTEVYLYLPKNQEDQHAGAN